MVYDLDGDGQAEVAVKTGEGDPRDKDGRVQTGPEYLTILDGLTGKPLAQVDWPSREGLHRPRGLQLRLAQSVVRRLPGRQDARA